MQAIRFDAAIPRYVLGRALGPLLPGIYWSGLSCTYSTEIPEPDLPGLEWVLVRTRLAGICGTDMGTIRLKTSPYLSTLTSFPFTLGHENVGEIWRTGPETPADWQPGDRVVVEPVLWCGPRGIHPPCSFCSRGEINRCEHYREGALAPGVITGACRDTGGSWSRTFTAHPLQLYRVPSAVSDENALMVEPFAIGLHAALLGAPGENDTVLLVGAGTIGLTTLAALRSLGFRSRVLVLARHEFQAAAARKLGADDVLVTRGADPYRWVAEQTGGQVLQPVIGKRVVAGGADLTIECAGSDAAIDQAMRFTRSGGRMILAGVPGIARGVDWTALFAQELTIAASMNFNHAEPWKGRSWKAFDLALHLLETGAADLGWMVTHRFRLSDYRRALQLCGRRGSCGMIKGAFDFT